MMNSHRLAPVALGSLLLLVGTVAGSSCSNDAPSDLGCTKDTDCKAERVCVNGSCVPPEGPQGGDPFFESGDGVSTEGTAAMPDECKNGAPSYSNIDASSFEPIPLQVLVQIVNGKQLLSDAQIQQDVDFANTFYDETGISFVIAHLGTFDNIKDAEDARSKNYFTLMYVDSIPDFPSACGVAGVGPSSIPHTYVRYQCAHTNSTSRTTAHELGHVLGLNHPHGNPSEKGDAEVEPLNSMCYDVGPPIGDSLCDTPPDPSPEHCDDPQLDCDLECAAPYEDYKPNPHLVMSYYRSKCMTPGSAFSPEQINTIRCVYSSYYSSNLKDACVSACTNKSCGAYSGCNCGWCDAAQGEACVNNQCSKDGCGNGVCDPGEKCSSCEQDCGKCPDGCDCNGGVCCSGGCKYDPQGTSCGECKECNSSGACSLDKPDGTSCGSGGTCQNGVCNGIVCSCNGGTCCTDGCDYDPQGTSCGVCKMCDGFGSCSQNKADGAACGGSNVCANGVCGPPPCGAATYWTPPLDSDTDNAGTQFNGTINTPITVEVKESGTGLEARVCKPGGTFSNDIAFSIYDGATNSTVGLSLANLAAAGKDCSGWVGLQNDNGYTEGQQFGGIWQVVSPASSANEWGWPYSSCPVNGSPGGTCWNGINITLTRTCK